MWVVVNTCKGVRKLTGKRRKNNGKIHLHVVISPETYELLRRLAPILYGGPYKGAISYVVEQALKAYLIPRQHAHKNANPEARVRAVYEQVKDCFAKIHGFIPHEVLYPELETCIGNVRGTDPRTIKKWVKIFESRGLIKWISPKSSPPRRTIIELL